MLAGTVVSKVISLVSVILIVRAVAPQEYGIFAFARSFPQLFAFGADLGIEPIFIRELAVNRGRAKELFSKLIPLKLALTVIVAALCAAFLFVSDKPAHVKHVTLAMTGYVLGRSALMSVMAMFKGLEKMGYIALCSIVESVVMLALVFYCIKRGSGALSVVYVYLFSLIALAAVLAPCLMREKAIAWPSVDFKFWREMALWSWPFAVCAIASMVIPNTDTVMISFFLGDTPAAYYSACVTMLGIVGFVQNSVTAAMFPAMSNIYANTPEALPRTYEKAFKLVSVTGLPLCVCGAAAAGPLLVAAYGANYAQAKTIFMFLASALVFTCYASFYAFFAAAINKQVVLAVVYGAVVFINIVLNYVFMLFWKVEGIAVSTLVCGVVLVGAIYLLVMRPYHRVEAGFFVRLAMCLASAAVTAYALAGVNVLLAGAASCAVYFVSFFVFKPLSDEDMTIVRNIFRLPVKAKG